MTTDTHTNTALLEQIITLAKKLSHLEIRALGDELRSYGLRRELDLQEDIKVLLNQP